MSKPPSSTPRTSQNTAPKKTSRASNNLVTSSCRFRTWTTRPLRRSIEALAPCAIIGGLVSHLMCHRCYRNLLPNQPLRLLRPLSLLLWCTPDFLFCRLPFFLSISIAIHVLPVAQNRILANLRIQMLQARRHLKQLHIVLRLPVQHPWNEVDRTGAIWTTAVIYLQAP